MQNSLHSHAFSKADRFNMIYRKPENNSIYSFKTSLNPRTTTFGFGNKWDMTKSVSKNPPPTAYTLPSIHPNPKKGITILGKKSTIVSNY